MSNVSLKVMRIWMLREILRVLNSISAYDANLLGYSELIMARRNPIRKILVVAKVIAHLLYPLTLTLRRKILYYIFFYDEEGFIGYIVLEYRMFDKVLRLRQIYVDINKRGRGYGKKLLLATLKAGKILNAKTVFLSVLKDNVRAIRLYEKYGFKPIKQIGGERLIYVYTIKH